HLRRATPPASSRTSLLSFFLTRPPPRSPLFPYTTLFRSSRLGSVGWLARLGWLGRRWRGRGTRRDQQRQDDQNHDGRRSERGSQDRKSTRLNSSHVSISYAVFCLKKKKTNQQTLIVAQLI